MPELVATTAPSALHETDRADLDRALAACLESPPVRGYFERRLVERPEISGSILEDGRLKEVLADTDYPALAEIRTNRASCEAAIAHSLRSGVRKPMAIAELLCAMTALVLFFAYAAHVGSAVVGYLHLTLATIGATSAAAGGHQFRVRAGSTRRPRATFSQAAGIFALVAMLPAAAFVVLHTLLDVDGSALAQVLGLWLVSLIGGIADAAPGARNAATQILRGCVSLPLYLGSIHLELAPARRAWKSALSAKLLPHVRQVITEHLGNTVEVLLVEQDVTGLKRSQDPAYVVQTGSDRRVRQRLAQMSAGTIALAGQRGAGKSTVLTGIVHGRPGPVPNQGVTVVVAAPTEYEPREFLLNLFQQLCETYLARVGYSRHNTMLTHLTTSGERIRRIGGVTRWAVGTLALVAIAGFSALTLLQDLQAVTSTSQSLDRLAPAAEHLWSTVRETWQQHHVLATLPLLAIVTIALWRRQWPRREPLSLADRASQYLYRLRINYTFNRGVVATLPIVRAGPAFGMTRNHSLSATAFTFPELVEHLRSFLTEVAKEEAEEGRRVVIGIDEVDRIGTIEEAERFIREVKAIFSIENCFFLITVADDVGASFAQRSLSTRGVFDSAFDDVISVQPLCLDEARNLLQRRATGFTEPYVRLLFSFSGGLPRELIRLARRLVDINQAAYSRLDIDQEKAVGRQLDLAPKIDDLAAALIREEVIQVVQGARRTLGMLDRSDGWVSMADRMGRLIRELSQTNTNSAVREMKEFTTWLWSTKNRYGAAKVNSHAALHELAAYVYFATTVLEFSISVDFHNAAHHANTSEQLSASRREIEVSPENAKAMLSRLRLTHGLTDVC